MVWLCLLDICAWDQVCRSSSIQKASRIKVQRHGWITIDLCNVEDQQKKAATNQGPLAWCEETLAPQMGFRPLKPWDLFINIPPWWPLALPWNLWGTRAVAGKKPVVASFSGSFMMVFLLSTGNTESQSSRCDRCLPFGRIGSTWSIGLLSSVSMFFGGVGGAAFLV